MHRLSRVFAAVAAVTFLFLGIFSFPGVRAGIVRALDGAVSAPGRFFANLADLGEHAEEVVRLKHENADLAAALAHTQFSPKRGAEHEFIYLTAPLFARYPWGNDHAVLAAAGEADGVRVGLAVTAGHFIFVGAVRDLGEHTSVIRTVYDPDWELPVRVGDGAAPALFVGGRMPRLTLLGKDEPIAPGDTVYLAASGFPYGLTIGTVAEVRGDTASGFREAAVAIPYDIRNLRELSILLP